MTTEWEASTTKRVGGAVRILREKHGMTAAEVAERAQAIGFELTKANVFDLEKGRKRTLTIADLTALAAVFGVSPVQLLYPDIPDGRVETIPREVQSTQDAIQWFTGESPFTPGNRSEPDSDTRTRLWLARERWTLNSEVAKLSLDVADWRRRAEELTERAADCAPEERPAINDEITVSVDALDRLLREMESRRAKLRDLTERLGAQPMYWDAR